MAARLSCPTPRATGSDMPRATGSDMPRATGSDMPRATGSDMPRATGSERDAAPWRPPPPPPAEGRSGPAASADCFEGRRARLRSLFRHHHRHPCPLPPAFLNPLHAACRNLLRAAFLNPLRTALGSPIRRPSPRQTACHSRAPRPDPTILRPWFLVEQPSESGGTSVLVYSSGPEQPDASGVELPTGVRGIIAL
jgi:hypothetical protein